MKKFNYLFLLILLTGCFMFIGGHLANAADMNYSVKAIIPENQMDKSKTYFDLKMTPGQQQTIFLELENTSDQEITLQVETNTATTNRNGVINYGASGEARDKSLSYDINELIKGDNEVVLLPKEKKRAGYTLKMPEKTFDGILLSGFYIHKKQTQEELELEKNIQIKNDFSYIIGMRLSETDKKVKPELKLTNITPGLQNYRTVVNATIQNSSPTIISAMTVEAKIKKKGSNKILHETKKINQSMAPNSSYEFPISWDNKELIPGKYTLSLKVNTEEKDEWKFSKEFEIKGDVKNLNEEAVQLEKENNMLVYFIGIAILILISVFYFIIKNKKKKSRN